MPLPYQGLDGLYHPYGPPVSFDRLYVGEFFVFPGLHRSLMFKSSPRGYLLIEFLRSLHNGGVTLTGAEQVHQCPAT